MKTSFRFLFPVVLLVFGCSKDDPSLNQSASATTSSSFNAGTGVANNGIANNGGTGVGQGGSLARFTIAQGHLYVVDDAQLYTYSLANPQSPVRTSVTNVGMSVETIYPFKNKLFIGSQQAMFIYSIANAGTPVIEGQATHVRACDPVVANDSVAYVTVRTGTTCGGVTNALLVYNIRNIANPVQVASIPLTGPAGLGLGANKRLYVCDGAAGLRVFDLANPHQPVEKKVITGHTFTDIIALDDLLVCGIEDGTALFTVASGDDIQFAARIAD